MDEDELKPMTDGDTTPPPAATTFEPAPSLKDTQAGFEPEPASPAEPKPEAPHLPATVSEAKQQAKDHAGRASQQAGEKAMMFADQGKGKAVDALEQLTQMLNDVAGQVDDKLGRQYGEYARTAAGTVQGFADQLREKKVDDLVDEARELIRKSPGAALGAAATLGFVVARLVSAGLDQRDA